MTCFDEMVEELNIENTKSSKHNNKNDHQDDSNQNLNSGSSFSEIPPHDTFGDDLREAIRQIFIDFYWFFYNIYSFLREIWLIYWLREMVGCLVDLFFFLSSFLNLFRMVKIQYIIWSGSLQQLADKQAQLTGFWWNIYERLYHFLISHKYIKPTKDLSFKFPIHKSEISYKYINRREKRGDDIWRSIFQSFIWRRNHLQVLYFLFLWLLRRMTKSDKLKFLFFYHII